MSDVFSQRLADWRAYTETPWARIRYAVIEETLRREVARLGTRLRILDVGGGDGMDALPLARAGHHVTILDQSRAWLEEAQRRAALAGVRVDVVEGDLASAPALGRFDLVLCHFVLQYLPDGAEPLLPLAAAVRPGGTLSVVLPNPTGMVLRQLVTGGPAAAREELLTSVKHAVVFNHQVRKIEMSDLERRIESAGLTVARRYGARIANDLLSDDGLKRDPRRFADLLELELALCDREPYLRIGGLYQLVATA